MMFREELEPRLLREHQRPSLRSTTASKYPLFIPDLICLDLPTTSTLTSVSSTILQLSNPRDSEIRLPVSLLPQFNSCLGFTSHMMRRIAKGPVKGISLKLQEEVSSKVRLSVCLGKREKDGLHPR